MSAFEHVSIPEPDWSELLEISGRVKFLLGCVAIADRASIAFHDGDLLAATQALMDYHAMRSEHASVEPIDPVI